MKKQEQCLPVREFISITMKTGDLENLFFSNKRAVEGTKGHRKIQQQRPDNYNKEVSVSGSFTRDDLTLTLEGRIDGVFTGSENPGFEEIKTTEGKLPDDWDQTSPLHQAQLCCYAYLYLTAQDYPEDCACSLSLTFFQLIDKRTQTVSRKFSLADLEDIIRPLVDLYFSWWISTVQWQKKRNESITALSFPFGSFRSGQRGLSVEVYRCVRDKEFLMVQAPTGIGKTVGVLFPAVKALGGGFTDKIFYLTARTTGKKAAENAVGIMTDAGLKLVTVVLTAKEKICFSPGSRCSPEECRFAEGYYDKIDQALSEVYNTIFFNRESIEALAEKMSLCPFELSLDIAVLADCIICDYNYVFDPRIYLKRFFMKVKDNYLFLIDEAQNFPDRARSMFSAGIEKKLVLNVRRKLLETYPNIASLLQKINMHLLAIRRKCLKSPEGYVSEDSLDDKLVSAVRDFTNSAENALRRIMNENIRKELLDFYFQCLSFIRISELFGTSYNSLYKLQGKSSLSAELFCLDPAPLLEERFKDCSSAIVFSATLMPIEYFKRIIFNSDDVRFISLPSPFPVENCRVIIRNDVPTRYKERDKSLEAVVLCIRKTTEAKPGNYITYFPSYAYLNKALDLYQTLYPEIPIMAQTSGMKEEERGLFLECFYTSTGPLLAFAVMGGIFGEGIDLTGDKLIGAIIVGVGLPAISPEKDLIRAFFQSTCKNGFAFAYQYPGFNRVLQAAGRVIRGEEDRGVILLLDERYSHFRYKTSFPEYWAGPLFLSSDKELENELKYFWE